MKITSVYFLLRKVLIYHDVLRQVGILDLNEFGTIYRYNIGTIPWSLEFWTHSEFPFILIKLHCGTVIIQFKVYFMIITNY
jgi:hypothetical protein